MSSARLEVLVEPFRADDPGPHVMAVLKVLDDHGFAVDMGPFSSFAEGPLDELIAQVQAIVQAAFDAGATSIQTRLEQL